jgi:tRNA(fMet)-specific endonuclease VapC
LEDRRVIIDTSIFIEYFRKENKQKTVLYHLAEDGYLLSTSSICYFEYLSGSKNREFDKLLFDNIEVVEFSKEQAYKASEIYQELKKKNLLIEFRDILIAASAMVQKCPLVTLNHKHFERITDLTILDL